MGVSAHPARLDDTLVCRGGTCVARRSVERSGVSVDCSGRLNGVSVNGAAGAALAMLTRSIPNRQVGVMTIDAIVRLGGDVRHATSGPWLSMVAGRDHSSRSSFIQTPHTDIELSGATAADQDFIAHARQDLPRLLAEIKAPRASAVPRPGP